jgi:hypothetical protein
MIEPPRPLHPRTGLGYSAMPTQCFTKKGSSPPVCGVHDVPLVEHQTSREAITGGVGNFTFFVCPVTGQVVSDPAKTIVDKVERN